jgi:hypothetical protein
MLPPIAEPVTTLTDYLLMLVASILAVFLWRIGCLKRIQSVRWWAVAFGGVAVAAGLGGTCHGFVYWMSGITLFRLWKLLLYAVSIASYAMLLGTIVASSSRRMQTGLQVGAGIKALLVWAILLQSPYFQIVVLDYGFSLGIVLVLQVLRVGFPTGQTTQLNRTRQSAWWMIAGVLVSGLAMAILASQFKLSAALNHNDLYHLVQLVGLGLLYQGAKQLQDQPG